MRGWIMAVGLACLAAQQPAPMGVVRGALLRCDAGVSGELTVRVQNHRVYFFEYDARTVIERDSQRARMSDLKPGDTLEIVSDAGPVPGARYARTIKVIDTRTQSRPAPASRPRPSTSQGDDAFPRGDLTFAGTVCSVAPEAVVLRTRAGFQTRILLRSDTRYLGGGAPAGRGDLTVNAHVFIRAGKNLDEQIEAYQVVWGAILKPE